MLLNKENTPKNFECGRVFMETVNRKRHARKTHKSLETFLHAIHFNNVPERKNAEQKPWTFSPPFLPIEPFSASQ